MTKLKLGLFDSIRKCPLYPEPQQITKGVALYFFKLSQNVTYRKLTIDFSGEQNKTKTIFQGKIFYNFKPKLKKITKQKHFGNEYL